MLSTGLPNQGKKTLHIVCKRMYEEGEQLLPGVIAEIVISRMFSKIFGFTFWRQRKSSHNICFEIWWLMIKW
jgi:hypothetical protein